ncbi:19550_t:CDS:2, partial [Gigaspora margarita]
QSDFTRDSRLENGYYSRSLEQFKNEHGEEGEFLIKQFKESTTSSIIKVFSTALNLKKNFLQLETSKNERDSLSDLQDLRELLQNHINSIEADKDIKYFENNRNAKDEKSLCELALVAEFGPIIDESDLEILSEIYVFMIQVKNHMMDNIYRSRLLNRANIPLEKNNEISSKLNKLMNKLSRRKQEWKSNNSDVDFDTLIISKAAKKLVLSQAITTSTPTSSPSHSNSTGSEKTSIADLLDLFLTPARAKETLKEMNILLSLEIVVFTADSNILLTPDRLPIGTDDDDLIPDIQI